MNNLKYKEIKNIREVSGEHSSFYGESKTRFPLLYLAKSNELSFFSLFGLSVCRSNLSKTIKQVISDIEKKQEYRDPRSLFYINAHCVNIARSDSDYYQILQESDYILPDGVGVWAAGKLAGANLPNLNGSDMFSPFCELLSEKRMKVGIIGAKPEVIERVKREFYERFPCAELVYAVDGFRDDYENEFSQEVDVLFVAMGVPMQERFYARNKHKIRAKLYLGIGAQLDFFSRRIKRAPKFMREYKVEWIFRFLIEPRRMFRRYMIGNFTFVYQSLRLKALGKESLQTKIK